MKIPWDTGNWVCWIPLFRRMVVDGQDGSPPRDGLTAQDGLVTLATLV